MAYTINTGLLATYVASNFLPSKQISIHKQTRHFCLSNIGNFSDVVFMTNFFWWFHFIQDIVWPTSALSVFFTFLIAPRRWFIPLGCSRHLTNATVETNAFLGSLNGRSFFLRYGDQKSNRVLPTSDVNLGSRTTRMQVKVKKTVEAFPMNTTQSDMFPGYKLDETSRYEESILQKSGSGGKSSADCTKVIYNI
jgi:hypothetical protein